MRTIAPALASLAAVAACATLVSAQDDATTIARRVEAFYAGAHTVRAAFQQDYWSDAYRRTTTARGHLAILRPGRVRLDYDGGLRDVVDGERGLHVDPADDGSPAQYCLGPTPIELGFLTGSSSILDAYDVSLGDPAEARAGCDVLVLRPREPSAYREIHLHVSHRAGLEGVVERVTLVSHTNDWNHFTFAAYEFDDPVPESTFDLTPPAGAREACPPGT